MEEKKEPVWLILLYFIIGIGGLFIMLYIPLSAIDDFNQEIKDRNVAKCNDLGYVNYTFYNRGEYCVDENETLIPVRIVGEHFVEVKIQSEEAKG